MGEREDGNIQAGQEMAWQDLTFNFARQLSAALTRRNVKIAKQLINFYFVLDLSHCRDIWDCRRVTQQRNSPRWMYTYNIYIYMCVCMYFVNRNRNRNKTKMGYWVRENGDAETQCPIFIESVYQWTEASCADDNSPTESWASAKR